jgi:tetratricopeptide (TPR) repeat protein
MYRPSLFLTAALVGTTVALLQPVALAKSASEIQSIAKAVTVEIKRPKQNDNGSGIIVKKQGNLYTLVTNRHVICGDGDCSVIPVDEVFTLELPDGQRYTVPNGSIKLLGSSSNIVDLALIQFRSNRNYAVVKLAASGNLKVEDEVFTSGFPCKRNPDPSIPCQPLGYAFGNGRAIAVVNTRLKNKKGNNVDDGGYTIVYDALTLPGMSGGGVFNSSGQLVAIHGRGERYEKNTNIISDSIPYAEVGSKIGYNRGIPIRWLVQNSTELGISLEADFSSIRSVRFQVPTSADEYFIAGFNKLVEPGDDVTTGKKQSIQEFSKAIQLNPKYRYAYFMRAYVYEQVQEFQKSLADYNQAITVDPRYSLAYDNRAVLKSSKLNDTQGALADFNQAISLNPKNSSSYYNRATLKYTKLNDVRGALADFNQAISLNPKNSEAYDNRGTLKYTKLNDVRGALADFNQAISLNPKNSEAYNNRGFLKKNKLNDMQGALDDYNQAIQISPKDSKAYYSRALLKYPNLNDIKGSLADYNQAISLNFKYAEAYGNRGFLKANKLNDRSGAIQDLRQAARLFREQRNSQDLQLAINALRELGATE